jgi:hypothetical protein
VARIDQLNTSALVSIWVYLLLGIAPHATGLHLDVHEIQPERSFDLCEIKSATLGRTARELTWTTPRNARERSKYRADDGIYCAPGKNDSWSSSTGANAGETKDLRSESNEAFSGSTKNHALRCLEGIYGDYGRGEM